MQAFGVGAFPNTCTATRHACDSCINQAVHVDVSVSGVLCCAHVCAVEGMHAVQG